MKYNYAKNKVLLDEYEDMMLGNRKLFSERFFSKSNTVSANHKNALIIIRYAFDRYLGWNKDMIAKKMTPEIIRDLQLSRIIGYVNFPNEFRIKNDYQYLASLLYDKKPLTREEIIQEVYESILSGTRKKCPHEFFVGGKDTVYVAITCLNYILVQYFHFNSVEETYRYFAAKDIFSVLKDYKLDKTCREYFQTPIDYLHYTLSDEVRDAFYYSYYKFRYLYEKTR